MQHLDGSQGAFVSVFTQVVLAMLFLLRQVRQGSIQAGLWDYQSVEKGFVGAFYLSGSRLILARRFLPLLSSLLQGLFETLGCLFKAFNALV